MPEQSTSSTDSGRVIPFRPRRALRSGWRWQLQHQGSSDTPVAGLGKYEGTKSEDDYRHRMTMNALALAATIMLVAVGVWLAVAITDMSEKQDCYLQGGRNCNQLAIPQTER